MTTAELKNRLKEILMNNPELFEEILSKYHSAKSLLFSSLIGTLLLSELTDYERDLLLNKLTFNVIKVMDWPDDSILNTLRNKDTEEAAENFIDNLF